MGIRMYTVYVLYSSNYGKIYIGYSSNMEERLKSHNELSKKGYTKNYRPWEIVYTEEFEQKKEAMRREKQLKGGQGRKWIQEEVISKIKKALC